MALDVKGSSDDHLITSCLHNAYIHSNVTNHMDIKPKNILVRSMQGNNLGYFMWYKDSSISRSYQTIFEPETESPTSFTKTYVAPEVISQSRRGLSADVFSLGCIFADVGSHRLDRANRRK